VIVYKAKQAVRDLIILRQRGDVEQVRGLHDQVVEQVDKAMEGIHLPFFFG
jgi:hypothetical protein